MSNSKGEELVDLYYKIIVVGEPGTGKTSIIRRFVHNMFSLYYKLGVDFAIKEIKVEPNWKVHLQIWDIAGQDRFGNMTRVYYKEAVGALVVFDETRGATLEAASRWKADIDSKVKCGPAGTLPLPVILLGNKCDLSPKDARVKDANEMNQFVNTHGFRAWFEVSAKDNMNIDPAMQSLIEGIFEIDNKIPSKPAPSATYIDIMAPPTKSECCK